VSTDPFDFEKSGPAKSRDATLAERAYLRLQEMIVTLRFPPGEILSEAILTKKLRIGRTPIREALKRLAREGLVLILPRRGVLVAEVNVKTQLYLIEARREIERLMGRLATMRATEKERSQFREIAEGLNKVAVEQDDILFVRLDRQLNLLLAQTARNEFVSKSMQLMRGLSQRFWFFHCREVADLASMARLHAEVAQAIADNEPEKAMSAIDRLNEYVEVCVRTAVDTPLGERPKLTQGP
jgi:DNA-binding GntR family transcriptional regulator